MPLHAFLKSFINSNQYCFIAKSQHEQQIQIDKIVHFKRAQVLFLYCVLIISNKNFFLYQKESIPTMSRQSSSLSAINNSEQKENTSATKVQLSSLQVHACCGHMIAISLICNCERRPEHIVYRKCHTETIHCIVSDESKKQILAANEMKLQNLEANVSENNQISILQGLIFNNGNYVNQNNASYLAFLITSYNSELKIKNVELRNEIIKLKEVIAKLETILSMYSNDEHKKKGTISTEWMSNYQIKQRLISNTAKLKFCVYFFENSTTTKIAKKMFVNHHFDKFFTTFKQYLCTPKIKQNNQ
ncbi:hypothetical protein RFI_01968, partial [Reticulomyxa filosa]